MHFRRGISVLLMLICFSLYSQEEDTSVKKIYTADRLQGEIIIDGLLDDNAWDQVDCGVDFIGHQPDYKAKPSQETQFKILYDEKFLYVGIRAFDTEPEKIVKRMSRRDGFEGDFVEINIDSYNDKRTAFSFTASVSGVKSDQYISNNGDNWDDTWDPIWYLKTSIDNLGWVAEFKIPLSQLRFANKEEHVWGLQVTRRFFRNEERSTWQAIDPNAPGWVHLFGELRGIKGIKPQKQLEILPYVLASAEKYQEEVDNPFRDSGKEYNGNVGVDAKVGLTSDITLDLTVNPDFGQVEADPSQVNLGAFELFFQERRPFFLEGNNVLNFGTSAGINNLFYSRRIGRRPQGYLQDDDIDHADIPNQTRLLGAAKVTGKNAKGFSWGVLESITRREHADVVDTLGNFRKEPIEPMTNYFATRFQQDIQGGKTVFGAIFTNVNRFNNSTNGMDLLHNNAQSAGVDLDHNFKDRKYILTLKYSMSRVEGTQGAIYNTQTSFQRSFQRTDNTYKSVDSTRTSLLGTAGTIAFGKRSGDWRWMVGSNYRSPELELDDIGFLRQTDIINNWIWTRYRLNKLTPLFRNQSYSFYTEQNLDFGGVVTSTGGNLNVRLQFKNFWRFNSGFFMEGNQVSNADLRGGPSIIYPGGKNWWYWIGTNDQKKFRFSFNNWYYWGNQDYTRNMGLNFNVTIRPTDALRISVSPRFSQRRNDLQYVTGLDVGDDSRYILGTVRQQTYSASVRFNYNITPNLTLEYWGQPFIASGEYSNFKHAHEPNSERYKSRFRLYNSEEIAFNNEDNVFEVNEQGGVHAYEFSNPDFNIVEYRSNFVVRWEYIPGSVLFLVWANNGSIYNQSTNNDFRNLSTELTNLDATNTFLIKYTYRFIL